jgi:hypothetical protein
MSWQTVPTFSVGDVLTAANMTKIGDDLTALNTRINNTATVATGETRANAAYGDLATVGPTVSSLTTGTFVIVVLTAKMSNNTTNGECDMSVDVSGATTTAAADANALRYQSASGGNNQIRCSAAVPLTVTAGSNTFKAKYRSAGADTATFSDRQLTVLPQF